jgi:hypothetical protein
LHRRLRISSNWSQVFILNCINLCARLSITL